MQKRLERLFRLTVRLAVLALVLTLTGGPLCAASLSLRAGPTLAAPHATGSVAGTVFGLVLGGVVAFGAIHIKDTGTLAKKFVTRATAASGDYKDGVAGAGAAWEQATKASGDNWAQGVQGAIANKMFDKGVAKAGQAKFVARATTLGAQRYPTGVGAAQDAWSAGVTPYLNVISGLNLPPRRPKGDPGNQARAQAVAAALRSAKTGH